MGLPTCPKCGRSRGVTPWHPANRIFQRLLEFIPLSLYACINCRRHFLRPGRKQHRSPPMKVEASALFLEPEDQLSMEEVLRELESAERRGS